MPSPILSALSAVVATPEPAARTAAAPAAVKRPLTAEQQAALKNLHVAAQRFESIFVNMLFKSMRDAAPMTSIGGGKPSPAETTFSEMLDQQRSDQIAQTGSFGIAKILEDQLKNSVLADPGKAARTRIAPEGPV